MNVTVCGEKIIVNGQMLLSKSDVSVVMANGSTRDEAIKHLASGTIVYNITEIPWSKSEHYLQHIGVTLDEIKSGKAKDLSYQEFDGVEYVIWYGDD